MNNSIEIVKKEVSQLLANEDTGHGMNHINRVVNISYNIAEKEHANKELVIIIALLHDVDDYKLFGIEKSEKLNNANKILNKTNLRKKEKEMIISSIKSIGYSKRLEGIIPENLEAKIVSDADMIDSMGAIGILRTFQYNLKNNNTFFDRNKFPKLNMSAYEYKNMKDGTSVNHLFEKILKLKALMLTEFGKKEAEKRYNFIVEFLKEYFYEEHANEWLDYLDNYIKNN